MRQAKRQANNASSTTFATVLDVPYGKPPTHYCPPSLVSLFSAFEFAFSIVRLALVKVAHLSHPTQHSLGFRPFKLTETGGASSSFKLLHLITKNQTAKEYKREWGFTTRVFSRDLTSVQFSLIQASKGFLSPEVMEDAQIGWSVVSRLGVVLM
jgi:hypothetical protein